MLFYYLKITELIFLTFLLPLKQFPIHPLDADAVAKRCYYVVHKQRESEKREKKREGVLLNPVTQQRWRTL